MPCHRATLPPCFPAAGPVFSLVLDEDVSESNALKFPQLYRELQKRRYLLQQTALEIFVGQSAIFLHLHTKRKREALRRGLRRGCGAGAPALPWVNTSALSHRGPATILGEVGRSPAPRAAMRGHSLVCSSRPCVSSV